MIWPNIPPDYPIMSLAYMIPILVAVTFLTLVEQKILSYVQAQKGPTTVGPFGLLQPMADGIKLLIKEAICPSTSSPLLFITTPVLVLLLALTIWTPLPFPLMDLNLSLLFLLAMSSLAVYSIPWSSWVSNSKYTLQAVAQTISSPTK